MSDEARGWARFQDLVFSDLQRYRTGTPTWLGVLTRCVTIPGMLASLIYARRVAREDRRIQGQCDELLERFGLEHLAGARISELPMGLVRIVEVARAMAMDAPFLLLDEPAAGLSREEQETLQNELVRLMKEGVGILLVEHNFGLVESLSDHVFVLERGQLIASGPPSEVAKDERVISAYLGGAVEEDEEEAHV